MFSRKCEGGVRGERVRIGWDVLFNIEKAIKKPQKKIRNKEVLALCNGTGTLKSLYLNLKNIYKKESSKICLHVETIFYRKKFIVVYCFY